MPIQVADTLTRICHILHRQEFDTVLAATGRTADISGLGLRATGVELGMSGKVSRTPDVRCE